MKAARIAPIAFVMAALLFIASGCGEDDDRPPRGTSSTTGAGGGGPENDPAACAPAAIWKRTDALLVDVAQALDLDAPCTELGSAPCAAVHRGTLGAAEPFLHARYKRPGSPFATTPLAFERVVLEACGRRVDADRAGPPRVFTALDLEANEIDPAGDAAAATVAELIRRFHGRTPAAEEVDAVTVLARGDEGAPRAASEFAVLACFAVGSSAELLFY